jgi:hypothetical protein
MVKLDDIDDAAEELQRGRALGLAGALVTVAPPRWRPFRSPAYDRCWAVAQDLDLPLSLHTATERGDLRIGDAAFTLDVKEAPPAAFINKDYAVRQAFAELIFAGVFERFPGLRVGSVEHEPAGSVPSGLYRIPLIGLRIAARIAYASRPPARLDSLPTIGRRSAARSSYASRNRWRGGWVSWLRWSAPAFSLRER